MQALRNQGIDEPYINLVEEICGGTAATIVLHNESDGIRKKRVRQEDRISSMLFTACLQEVFRALDYEELGITFNGEYLSNLQLADYISLISNSGDELWLIITELDTETRKVYRSEI